MGEIVNLRRVRKSRAKAEEQAKAEGNRALHGSDKAAKADDDAETARRRQRDRTLDSSRIERDEPDT